MMAGPDLFVTGAARSGTSLLDKLLSLHRDIEVLSQPLPRLFVEAKRQFLSWPSDLELAFPLNDLFGSNYRPPKQFTAFLTSTKFDPEWLTETLRAMSSFAGQYVQPEDPPEALAPDAPIGLASFVARYLRVLAPDAAILGSKEVYAEEFVPYLLHVGTRVLLLVRDPCDVAASVFGRAGAEHAGQGIPLLFVLRQWRKSVAFALEHAAHPGFRLVRYEDLVAEPANQMAAIAAWLGCGAFPTDLADLPLTGNDGAPWCSNSSHRPLAGISTDSIGMGHTTLPVSVIRAIETLCAPEMRALGYDPHEPAGSAALATVTDPCAEPRAVLAPYVWSEAALAPEFERLDALDTERFTPHLHLFDRAFRHLTRSTTTTSWRPVLGGRASALIHDLASASRPGSFLLPANICPQVVLALTRAGRPARYVDLDPDTLAMQPEAVLRIIRAAPADVAGVIHARTYGALPDASEFFAAVKALDPEILVIDDRCACRPALDPVDVPCGPDAIVYSTGFGKYADLGGGGYAFLAPGVPMQRHDAPFDTNHAAALDKALTTSEGVTTDAVSALWPNWLETRASFGSWPAFRAALAAERDRIDVQKARINAIYTAAIPRAAWLGPAFNDWRFNLCVADKETLLAEIFAAGVFASGHYRPTARILGGYPTPTPGADALYARVVNLFNDRYATPELAKTVAEIVRRHLAGCAAAEGTDAS